jgi:hypothetical protein
VPELSTNQRLTAIARDSAPLQSEPMTPLPSYEAFVAAVGSTFTIAAMVDADTGDTVEVDLELHAATEPVTSSDITSWSLEFHGPLEWAFDQSMATLEHADLGRIDLFLVPLGPAGERMRYEAVFAEHRGSSGTIT